MNAKAGLRRVVDFGLARMPFADAASQGLPLGRLLRLGLFQVSVGMAMTLTAGTLNRVMIVELNVSAGLVALMVSLPMLAAPARALIGFKSDNHKSAFGWKRVPYLWQGTMLQFGGLAIMPFALLLINGDHNGSLIPGRVGATLAFLLLGAGASTVQTAGLALATDLADEKSRPRVVALLYLMLLVGMGVSALLYGALLRDFTNTKLVGVVQGAAVLTVLLNVTALWKQEARNRDRALNPPEETSTFREAWQEFTKERRVRRLLVAVALGTFGFNMQDILLEPYGGQVLHMSVGATTLLTALMASGSIAAFALAAKKLAGGSDPLRLSALGIVAGMFGFGAVIISGPIDSAFLFRCGTTVIGFGAGLFGVGTLTAAMARDNRERNGLAVGAWGAVQATCAGLSVALGGLLRDGIASLASSGRLGEAMQNPTVAYGVVYHLEIAALFAALIIVGPLVAPYRTRSPATATRFGLAELPG